MQSLDVKRRQPKSISSVVILSIGVAAVVLTIAVLPVASSGANLGPRFWPLVASVIMAGCGVILAVESLWKSRSARVAEAGGEDQSRPADPSADLPQMVVVRPRNHLYLFALLSGYVIAASFVGYAISTLIFAFIANRLMFRGNLFISVIVAVAYTASTIVVFGYVLGILLPRGVGWFYYFNMSLL